ncbi:fatty acid desaturase (macronuclear) [Tetrahymena thermophila SB210]|uniref:Fatty acid desaturase n=1 Tax=Tetrahymena thermophila (strain SB210) TaxID=312017 RepID=I7M480_TETTS|nr:fatty acid desaturase [Tetrahymena thermophila SB210]EAS05126.1 fatty acid desaturase [Tetrahymena thermophila SB210]|eukprot:XP_001025371.1 fatty acid desaturase [Tetrahymena thermophila SB210]
MSKQVEDKKFEADPMTPIIFESIQNKQSSIPKDYDIYTHTGFEKRKDYFHIMPHEEPHTIRRNAILKKYPDILKLYVKDPISGVLAAAIAIFQVTLAYYVQNCSWPVFLTCMYVISASLNHTMHCLVHDLTHYTAFESINLNRLFACIANIPSTVPSAMSFGYYHREHHVALGHPQRDTDLPTEWEIRFFNTPLKKMLYIFLMPLFYCIRPFVVAPKPPTPPEIFNLLFILTTDYLIFTYVGPYAFLYLFISGIFSMGFHPLAIHAIAEHYEFVKGQENYDYFGSGNILNLNLGYHLEHHDFPQVPWRLLPKVRAMAPEFYEGLPHHTSYWRVAYEYIFNTDIGPFSRIDTSEIKLKKDS